MNPYGAVVLAGGKSRRMGRAKAWLTLNQEPLLVQMVRQLVICCSAIVVVGREERKLPRLPKGVQLVQDHQGWSGGGPLIGLYSGLLALQNIAPRVEMAYLSGCDNPRLSEVHVRKMFSLLEEDHKQKHQRVWPIDEQGRGNPLCGALRVDGARLRSRELLDSGERRLSKLFEDSETLAVDCSFLPDPEVLLPCNTPEQWDRLRAEREP